MTEAFFIRRAQGAWVAAALAGILGWALWIRFEFLWLPHWRGDQHQYIALAMKLEKAGFPKGYNLREVNSGQVRLLVDPPIDLSVAQYAPGERGNLLGILSLIGQSY